MDDNNGNGGREYVSVSGTGVAESGKEESSFVSYRHQTKRIRNQRSHATNSPGAEAGPMSREVEIDLFCSDHEGSGIMTTTTKYCQFTGCFNAPKYGQRKGPLKFCPKHKRVGMYTNRNGQLLLATRDGSAFRDEDNSEEVADARSINNFAVRKEILDNVAGDGTTGTNHPRFCTSHKKEVKMGLNKRLCISPGCSTRPHYGLLGSRAIYCAKHKEANMVHLLTEATIRGKMDVTRDPRETDRTPSEQVGPPSKRFLSVSRFKGGKRRRNTPKKNADCFQYDDNEELGSRTGSGAGSLPPVRKQQNGKRKGAGKNRAYCRSKAGSSTPVTSSLSTSTRTPASSNKDQALLVLPQVRASVEPGDPRKCGSASGASPPLSMKTPSSRLADTLGMTPSFGIRVVKDAKESAQAETIASRSGRRARTPSRKALEASGKLITEGIQWLTKEKKEEETRRMKEIKARRKAATEVGMRAEHVIETTIIDPMLRVESTGTDSSDADNVAKVEPAKIRWHKLSPVKIMELSARKLTTKANAKKTDPRDGRHVASVEREKSNRWWGDSLNDVARTSVGKRKEIVWYPQISARAITSESDAAFPQDAKRRKESYEDRSSQMRQAMPSAKGKEPWEVPTWASTSNDTGSDGVIEIGGVKVCQFEDCARKATFGVNGIVRYCKLHAIFGMRRINIPV